MISYEPVLFRYARSFYSVIETAPPCKDVARMFGAALASLWFRVYCSEDGRSELYGLEIRLRGADYPTLVLVRTPSGRDWVEEEFADTEVRYRDGHVYRKTHISLLARNDSRC